jgi:hypothetical protein
MTLYDFIALSDNDQADITWNGVYLGARIDNESQVILYSLYNFYVEVYYSPALNEIQRLRPFRNISQVQPYIDGISLSELI